MSMEILFVGAGSGARNNGGRRLTIRCSGRAHAQPFWGVLVSSPSYVFTWLLGRSPHAAGRRSVGRRSPMRELQIRGVAGVVTFGVLFLVISRVSTEGHAILAVAAAMFAFIAHINYWLWARCRSWPVVTGEFEDSSSPTAHERLRITYEFEGEAFSRVAATSGAPGNQVPIRVNPDNPTLSSLDLPKPNFWLVSRALAVLACTVVVSHALLTS